MRVFFPALGSELSAAVLPQRHGWAAFAPQGASNDDIEELENDAQTEAALASLSLLQDFPDDAPSRVVLAIEIPEAPLASDIVDGVGEVRLGGCDWKQVKAILIDGSDACEAVRSVVAAQDQDSADQAVADLWEYALEWYDIQEREVVARMLASNDG
ncbi:DUF6912 family protein [Schaalia vaccimaxillae]|uniref:DUF6912 family protein n=1 Tax=Schaalia vaccimaxillae TaxID=183916 RepID=UPI0003B33013|nr:hypothetical protein [Schaalia vaccimaxillae]